MSDLRGVNAVFIVFAMPGCPACDDYLPRFKRQVAGFQQFGHPLVFHAEGANVAEGTIPILIFDATSTDQGVQQLADQHAVSALPTTVLLTRWHGAQRHEGALDDKEIYKLLVTACEVSR